MQTPTGQLRAVEARHRRRNLAGEQVERASDVRDEAFEDIGNDSKEDLIAKADGIVALRERLRVVHATSEVTDINAG